jgi:hypothetical protein
VNPIANSPPLALIEGVAPAPHAVFLDTGQVVEIVRRFASEAYPVVPGGAKCGMPV